MFEQARQAIINKNARDYARWLIALAVTEDDRIGAVEYFRSRWPSAPNSATIIRAAVAAGASDGSTWGDALVPIDQLASEFAAVVRQRSIIGQMSGYRSVPFNVRIPIQTGGAGGAWVAQRGPTPARGLSFTSAVISPTKVAGIVVLTDELARFSDPAAEDLVVNDLVGGLAEFLDQQLLEPTLAEIADVSPASITYGAPIQNASGTTSAAATDDLIWLVSQITTSMRMPFFIMTPKTAVALASFGLVSGTGSLFPDIGAMGGTLLGIPVITSGAVPANGSSPGSSRIVLIDAAELIVADGGIDVAISRQGNVQLNDAPDSPATASTTLVSLWQLNLVGFLVSKQVHWKMRRSGAVAVLDAVDYG